MHMRARLCVCVGPKNGRSPGKRSNVSSGEASASWNVSFFFPFVKSREPTFLYIYIFSLSKSKESKAEKLFDQSSNFHEIIKYKVSKVSPCLHEISLGRGVDWPRIYICRYPVGYMQA